MRLTFFGTGWKTPPVSEKPEVGPDGAHSYCAMGPEFCRALRARGVQASHTNFWYTDEQQVKNSEAFDAVFLADHGMFNLWKQVTPDWDWAKKTNIFNVHIADPDPDTDGGAYCQAALRHATAITFIHERVRDHFLYEFGYDKEQICHVLPWAVAGDWSWPPAEPSPYPDGKRIVLWAGRIYPRAMPLLQYLEAHLPALNAELHVLRAPSMGPVEIPDDTIPGTFHGSMKHGTFNHFLYYANCGLDVGTWKHETPVVHCKVFDYLYAGLPVVHERVLGSEMARRLNMSRIVECQPSLEPVDLSGFMAGISKTLARSNWPKVAARDYMRKHHTWTNRADGLVDFMRTNLGLPFGAT